MKEAVVSCRSDDMETIEVIKGLFPDAFCMQVDSITGVEVMEFVVSIAGLYAAMNISSTIKDLMDHDKVELKIGEFSVKGSYKHAVELTDKYLHQEEDDGLDILGSKKE